MTAVELGHWVRTCDSCGKGWGPERCSDSHCSSIEFTDTYHEPKPMLSGLVALVTPKAKPKPRASAAQVASLRALQAATTRLLADLRSTDAELITAVRSDVSELIPAQAAVATALSITGDASPGRAAHLSLALAAFSATLGRAITTLEETK
jgi:hypothetical protein